MYKELQYKYKAKITDYESVVGKTVIEELKIIADNLAGKKVLNVNSTYVGGGVAEILTRMIPFLNQLGIDARWEVIKGDNDFFTITKKFHNTLHGQKEIITDEELAYFKDVNEKNSKELNLNSHIIFIHDPQPVALINRRDEFGEKWLWRCHIDISNPDERIWNFIREYVIRYDGAVFSSPNFAKPLPNRMFLIYPSIDPLSEKNRELSQSEIEKVLDKYKIDKDKPIILQVSRFDYLKDPVGVIKAFKIVKKNTPSQLILAGGTATDDPESDKVLEEVKKEAEGDPDIYILILPPDADFEINALQRAANIILQKSIKEGFGLTVTEALWKSKPVVASAVGGIILQVKDKLTGLLCHSIEGAAYAIKTLLTNPDYARWLGNNGKAHVKENFLITRHLKDYLLLFTSLYYDSDIIYL